MKSPFNFSKMKKDGKVQRTFSYTNDGIVLNFTLRIDEKTELKKFMELLVEAQKDVQEELEK